MWKLQSRLINDVDKFYHKIAYMQSNSLCSLDDILFHVKVRLVYTESERDDVINGIAPTSSSFICVYSSVV
jgi:hypothetical protein